ncbi:hypothetical protein CEXT_484721 [Caerostris extrusa]|uniref:Uncharacterized protein n=1 Tax=Caerostris extrusa TaxID=172846 RepID=A0AAV4TFU4_CAEEX|nr:hypothetical protein CEXT_484721 [Caerostris extrusa]
MTNQNFPIFAKFPHHLLAYFTFPEEKPLSQQPFIEAKICVVAKLKSLRGLEDFSENLISNFSMGRIFGLSEEKADLEVNVKLFGNQKSCRRRLVVVTRQLDPELS